MSENLGVYLAFPISIVCLVLIILPGRALFLDQPFEILTTYMEMLSIWNSSFANIQDRRLPLIIR